MFNLCNHQISNKKNFNLRYITPGKVRFTFLKGIEWLAINCKPTVAEFSSREIK